MCADHGQPDSYRLRAPRRSLLPHHGLMMARTYWPARSLFTPLPISIQLTTVSSRRLQTMFPPKRNHSKSALQHSIELKHLNRMRSYGTVPSEDLEADTSPSQQHIRSRKREQARKRSNVKGFGALVMTMCPMLFLWCSLSKDRDTSAVEPPSLSPPHLSGDTSLYLWLVEHDSHAHGQNFATLRTLFAIDMYATNTTDGMFFDFALTVASHPGDSH